MQVFPDRKSKRRTSSACIVFFEQYVFKETNPQLAETRCKYFPIENREDAPLCRLHSFFFFDIWVNNIYSRRRIPNLQRRDASISRSKIEKTHHSAACIVFFFDIWFNNMYSRRRIPNLQ